MQIDAIEFQTAREAVDHAKDTAEDYKAILWQGYKAVKSEDVDRLVDAGIQFAFLCDHEGRIVTIPVN